MIAASAATPRRAASNPVARLRAGMQRWLQLRMPRSDTLLLTQRNIYIVPTRAGLMFGFTLLVLLLASINYQLNLGYALTFLLAGSGIVSMVLTHATLRGLTLRLKPPAPVFAGDAVLLDVVLTSPGAARFGIGLKMLAADDSTISWTDVPAGGQASAQLSFVARRRGLHEVPSLRVATRFPLGLFGAWTVWRPAAFELVYPQPEPGAPALPAARPARGGAGGSRSAESGEIDGVRAYRRGDSLRRIAWKKSASALATGGELVSRELRTSARAELWLDWLACNALAPEDRLSRLAAWTLTAEHAGADYGLRLPGLVITAAAGDAQRHRCLEALALWR